LKTPKVADWGTKIFVSTSVYYTYINTCIEKGFIKAFKKGASTKLYFEVVLPFPKPPAVQCSPSQFDDERTTFWKNVVGLEFTIIVKYYQISKSKRPPTSDSD
jgi:hypothetical protein